MIPTIQHTGKGKTVETLKISTDIKKICVAKGQVWRGMNGESVEDFQGSGAILYGTAIADICHYAFVKMHRMNNIKTEP